MRGMLTVGQKKKKLEKDEVPPRFELGSLDSESRVLTITPWDLVDTEGKTDNPIARFLSNHHQNGSGLVRDLNPGPLAP